MPAPATPGSVLRELWARLDARDWDGTPGLDPALRVRYPHTGETFDRDGYVRLNRAYPGRWRAAVDDLVCAGNWAVSRARVSDGAETFHVASFATVRAGLLRERVELWTDSDATPPDRRPAS